jgi:transcriptional regulator with XRE-family HTH domain
LTSRNRRSSAWFVVDDAANRVISSIEVRIRVGAEIRRLRTKKGFSINYLARKIGVSSAFLSDCERGSRRLTHVEEISRELDVDPETIFDLVGVCHACHGTGLAKKEAEHEEERGGAR